MTRTPPTGMPQRKVALTAGFGLLFMALLVFIRHEPNIRRLIRGGSKGTR